MISLNSVSKVYGTGKTALDTIDLHIDKGEFVFLVGTSGSGKTTLLRLLIRDILPSSGSILVNDLDIVKLPNNKISHLRKKIGVVFQDLKLLTDRTIFENIILPLEMTDMDQKTSRDRVNEIMKQVGIEEHVDKFPVQLSGGELQRAAIARALAFSPDILLADEPTGNLDTATSWEIVKLLQDINQAGTTVIMATHNTDIVNSLLKRVISLEKGKMIGDTKKKDKKEDNAPTEDKETEKDTKKDKENDKESTKSSEKDLKEKPETKDNKNDDQDDKVEEKKR